MIYSRISFIAKSTIMAPSAIDPVSQDPGQPEVVRPPHLFTVKEAHFESFIEPQPDGYEKAVSRGLGNVAIVIDNGMLNVLCLKNLPKLVKLCAKS